MLGVVAVRFLAIPEFLSRLFVQYGVSHCPHDPVNRIRADGLEDRDSIDQATEADLRKFSESIGSGTRVKALEDNWVAVCYKSSEIRLKIIQY